MENVCFGKEIKSLNILKNPNYSYGIFNNEDLFLTQKTKQDIFDVVNRVISVYGCEMGNNIRYITSKLIEARENSENKLIKIMPERQDRKPVAGVFIYKQFGVTFTSFYYADYTGCVIDKDSKTISGSRPKIELIQFIDNKLSLIQSTLTSMSPDEVLLYDTITKLVPKEMSEGRNIIMDALDICLEFDFLLNHIEVEEKHLVGKSKVNGFGTVYSNVTTNNIKIIDSKWFTTLIKSDAFTVRGHFRFQPCGAGFKDKKLIWINDFEKTGYTAPAQKLKQG